MATLIPITDFQQHYEVKNGFIGDSATLNLAVDAAQQEIIALWQFVADDSISSGDKLINDDLAFSEYLIEKAGVALVPGTAFGCPGHIRISIATSMENLKNALDRIKRAI
jgi:aspartate/methionine/tyrosine aminotransferase